MKVRCIRLLDATGAAQEQSSWLTIGNIYHVLEVIQDKGRWLFRIMGDDPNGLALFQLQQFEIVTSKIPSSWIARWGEDGFFEMTPERWCQIGFWERYYDRDPEAVRAFEEERKNIIADDI